MDYPPDRHNSADDRRVRASDATQELGPGINPKKLRYEILRQHADHENAVTAELIRRMDRIDDIVCGGTRGQKLIDILARAIDGEIKVKVQIVYSQKR